MLLIMKMSELRPLQARGACGKEHLLERPQTSNISIAVSSASGFPTPTPAGAKIDNARTFCAKTCPNLYERPPGELSVAP